VLGPLRRQRRQSERRPRRATRRSPPCAASTPERPRPSCPHLSTTNAQTLCSYISLSLLASSHGHRRPPLTMRQQNTVAMSAASRNAHREHPSTDTPPVPCHSGIKAREVQKVVIDTLFALLACCISRLLGRWRRHEDVTVPFGMWVLAVATLQAEG
jgi:hypothetical protein